MLLPKQVSFVLIYLKCLLHLHSKSDLCLEFGLQDVHTFFSHLEQRVDPLHLSLTQLSAVIL